jgi:hypothetical protein
MIALIPDPSPLRVLLGESFLKPLLFEELAKTVGLFKSITSGFFTEDIPDWFKAFAFEVEIVGGALSSRLVGRRIMGSKVSDILRKSGAVLPLGVGLGSAGVFEPRGGVALGFALTDPLAFIINVL